MAILHRATLTPTKPALVEAWLDRQPWGGDGALEVIGSYRFDDPAGAVGVEAILVRRGGRVLHVPLTYRGAPLDGAEDSLVGTVAHSVLGTRWVYEGAGDPVAVGCFTRALAGEQEQAALELYEGEELVARPEPAVRLQRRPGAAATAGDLRLAGVLADPAEAPDGAELLVATWSDGEAVVAVR